MDKTVAYTTAEAPGAFVSGRESILKDFCTAIMFLITAIWFMPQWCVVAALIVVVMTWWLMYREVAGRASWGK